MSKEFLSVKYRQKLLRQFLLEERICEDFSQYFAHAKILLTLKVCPPLHFMQLLWNKLDEALMREEFGLFSVECQKINPLAYFSILEGGSLHFDYVFHYIFQNNSLLLEKFHDIIAWRTLVKMKSKKRKCTLLIKLFLWLRNTFFH